jgi:cytochrome c biogenesis protein CcdA
LAFAALYAACAFFWVSPIILFRSARDGAPLLALFAAGLALPVEGLALLAEGGFRADLGADAFLAEARLPPPPEEEANRPLASLV